MVAEERLELSRGVSPADFESAASANSATRPREKHLAVGPRANGRAN